MEKIAQIIVNSMNLLGRKIDSLAMELRNQNRKPNSPINIPPTEVKFSDFTLPSMDTIGIEKAIQKGLESIQVNVPEIKIPKNETPIVNVEAPIVNVPPANITVTPTPIEFPKEMKVEGMKELIKGVNRETSEPKIFEEITSKSPLAVMIVDKKGRHIEDFASELTSPSMVAIRVGTTAIGEDNPMPTSTDGFMIPVFDQQIIEESGAPALTTITYKKSGVTVATKSIVVSGTTTTITVIR